MGRAHNIPTQAARPYFALASFTFATPNFQKTPSRVQVPPLTSGWNLHQVLIGRISKRSQPSVLQCQYPSLRPQAALDGAHRLLSLPLDASLLISFNQPIMYCQPHSGILIGTWSQAPLLPPPLGPQVASGHHGLACRSRECQVTIRLAPRGAHGRRASLSLSLFLL